MSAQEVLDEILAVCQKHNYVLMGTCISEGIYGEILISPNDKVGWRHPETQRFNELRVDMGDSYVDAIGNIA